MNKFKLSVYCFLFALALTTIIHAGETRQIRAVFVQETGSSTPSVCATAKATISGTSLRILLSETDTWIGPGKVAMFTPMTVRYFDEDGNYLGRFKTKDVFLPKWVTESEDVKPYYIPPTLESTIFGKDTAISYKINARDAAFIGIIELAFDNELGFTLNRDLVQK